MGYTLCIDDVHLSHLERGEIDLIIFTSSSSVKNFRALIPSEKFQALIKHVTIASIGPITTDTARDFCMDVHRQGLLQSQG
ncbi:MAG TPA: uroporphyrinogen-III synthase [Desulfobacterales bacterium]|nr:uroporphyrinogen-III synthase [Desulfobacterales bacterium]